jgi:hypothetical protein
MLRRSTCFTALALAVPLLWALPAAALDFRPTCPAEGGGLCETHGTFPPVEVQPGQGRDTVIFDNGHDAAVRDQVVSSEDPHGMDLEVPSEPPSGEGEMGGGDGQSGEVVRSDHHVFEGDPDAVGDAHGFRNGDAPAVVPEPGELLLLALAAGGLLLGRRRA